jgi:hypothetical protein
MGTRLRQCGFAYDEPVGSKSETPMPTTNNPGHATAEALTFPQRESFRMLGIALRKL